MKRWLVLALLCCPAPALAAAESRPKLVVLQLKAGQGVDEKGAATLTSVVIGDAARVGFSVVSQADVAAMLAYQKARVMLGCSDEGCLAELGGALGADYVLAGEVAVVGTRAHQSLTLLDARKGAVVGRSAGFSDAGEDPVALALLARFRAVVQQGCPDRLVLAPPVEPPGAAHLRSRRTAAWWTLGAGGVLLAGGAVTGLVARKQASDLESSWQKPNYSSLYDAQRRTALTADVLMAAGVVTAGAGLWLVQTSKVPVVVLPQAGADGAGVSVAARF